MFHVDLDSPAARPIRTLFWVLTAAAALMLAPIRNPGFLDYMNHLARFFVMTRDFHTPFYHAHYVDNFHIFPNLGVDLLVVGLGQILPTEIALKLVVMSSVVLVCAGFYRLSLQAHDNKVSPVVLLFPVLAYRFPLFLGFLNFFLGMALLPWALMALRSKPVSHKWYLAIFAWAISLYFTHFFALLVFLFLALLDSFLDPEKVYQNGQRAALAVTLLLAFVLYKLSPTSQEQSGIVWSSPADKVKFFFAISAFGPYWILPTILFFGLLIFILIRGKVSYASKDLRWVLAMTGLFLVCPFGLAIAASYDARLPVLLFALVISLGTVRASSDTLRKGVTFVAAALAVTHLGITFATMRITDRETARVASILKPIPSGASVVTVPLNPSSARNRWTWWPNLNMIQFAAVPERPMLVHGMFSFKSQQPVLIKDSVMNALSIPILDPSGDVAVQQKGYDSWRAKLPTLIEGTSLKEVYVLVIDFERSGARIKTDDEVLYADNTFQLIRCLLPTARE